MLLSLEDVKNFNQKIVFSPNPFKRELLITAKSNFENASLKIFNSIVQLVKEENNLNGEIVLVKRENLNSGIYFAQLSKGEKIIATNKIMITD